jgi:phosphoribosylaminoimidazole-succinocarboxamide synthase
MAELLHRGKVRDVYADGSDLILLATDRVSVYDVVLPTPIPDKGKVLTRLSLWWFERLADIVPNHVKSATNVPDGMEGRAIRCQRLDMLDVECIARGYLAGLGLQEYERDGAISGVELPSGLQIASKLGSPIFTPTTKAAVGTHDEFMTFADVERAVGPERAAELRDRTLAIYSRAVGLVASSGVIIADTKLEFGVAPDGELTLGDEVLTPDSSRFWRADEWQPGHPPKSYDKQFVRDWSNTTGWDRTAPGPEVPPAIVEATRQRYFEVYELITGEPWR